MKMRATAAVTKNRTREPQTSKTDGSLKLQILCTQIKIPGMPCLKRQKQKNRIIASNPYSNMYQHKTEFANRTISNMDMCFLKKNASREVFTFEKEQNQDETQLKKVQIIPQTSKCS
jgi:hypothetical protein